MLISKPREGDMGRRETYVNKNSIFRTTAMILSQPKMLVWRKSQLNVCMIC